MFFKLAVMALLLNAVLTSDALCDNDVRYHEPFIKIRNAYYQITEGSQTVKACSNFTSLLAQKCDGHPECDIGRIHPDDAMKPFCSQHPSPGVPKRARVTYTCNWTNNAFGVGTPSASVYEILLRPTNEVEAVDDGKQMKLSCKGKTPLPVWQSRIKVQTATYGTNNHNCPFTTLAVDSCNGRTACEMRIDAELCGKDPDPGVAKPAVVTYSCVYQWYPASLGNTPPASYAAKGYEQAPTWPRAIDAKRMDSEYESDGSHPLLRLACP